MTTSSEKSSDLLRVEIIIGNLLRWGVIVCAFVIALGAFLSLINPPEGADSLSNFLGTLTVGGTVEASGVPSRISEFFDVSAYRNPYRIVSLGLILLILLPILRVAMTLVLFALEKDRFYVVVTSLVLAVLLFGLVFGRAL